jgi:hypothetical protein
MRNEGPALLYEQISG